ncbi:MAG TPA: hypothetical protein VLN42_01850 [Casimicrobiaceae bacterium]|nr:hypothetical protein [Casimicrobiaceae bacterium]
MKRILVGTALALFGLAPAIGSACEYNEASMASSTPAAQTGPATPPAASTAPAPVVAKAATARQVKQASDKATSPTPNAKLAAVANRN